jgi:hypothetical protein
MIYIIRNPILWLGISKYIILNKYKYKITSVSKVETDIFTSSAASPI